MPCGLETTKASRDNPYWPSLKLKICCCVELVLSHLPSIMFVEVCSCEQGVRMRVVLGTPLARYIDFDKKNTFSICSLPP